MFIHINKENLKIYKYYLMKYLFILLTSFFLNFINFDF